MLLGNYKWPIAIRDILKFLKIHFMISLEFEDTDNLCKIFKSWKNKNIEINIVKQVFSDS